MKQAYTQAQRPGPKIRLTDIIQKLDLAFCEARNLLKELSLSDFVCFPLTLRIITNLKRRNLKACLMANILELQSALLTTSLRGFRFIA